MSIQSSINQTLGATAIAAKLSPQLQELGEKIRTNEAIGKTEKKLKDVTLKGQIAYDKDGQPVGNILDDPELEHYQALAAQKRALDTKAGSLGLTTTDWKNFGPDVMSIDEAHSLELQGIIQRNKVEAMKNVKQEMRDYQFGGKNYGSNKQ